MVPGVNEAAAKSRVAKLAVKVRALLSSSAELSVALPEVAAPQQLPPHPCLRAGGAQPLRQAEPEEQQEDDLGLPPLTATRELPKATSPLPSPTDAENSDVERMIVKPFELLALMPPALTAPASALLAAPSPTMMPLATTTTASAPPTSIPSASILPASMPTASVVPEIPSRSAPKLSSRLHPFDKAAYEAFIVPERARADFDKTRTHIFFASRCSTLICDAWCRRHYDGTGRCQQSTLLWRRTRGTTMHAVPDDTSEAMATCMALAPNRRTSVTSGKICSRQPLQVPSRTSGTTTRVRTVIQTAAKLRRTLKELQLAITCNRQTSLAILRRHLTTSRKTSVMTMSLSRPRCSFMQSSRAGTPH